MRLADLDASFVSTNGVRTGVQFICPACSKTRIVVPFACETPDPSLNAHGVLWRASGDTLDTLTLKPSVDARHVNGGYDGEPRVECRWHGWVTAGGVTAC